MWCLPQICTARIGAQPREGAFAPLAGQVVTKGRTQRPWLSDAACGCVFTPPLFRTTASIRRRAPFAGLSPAPHPARGTHRNAACMHWDARLRRSGLKARDKRITPPQSAPGRVDATRLRNICSLSLYAKSAVFDDTSLALPAEPSPTSSPKNRHKRREGANPCRLPTGPRAVGFPTSPCC